GINATGGWFRMLAIGENTTGESGIDFKVNSITKGTLYFTSNSGFLTQPGGTMKISTSGDGLILQSNGNFSMGGTEAATGYRLSVHGKVMATDYTALSINNWPDYVFDNKYKLMPLTDVKNYINKHKHLPNIPAAAEIEKNGIQLGDMSKRLMEKVEELTLYILQLQDQVDELKKQIPSKK
ncbi:MAG TPA: hypothetical protein VK484_04300, partial [Ferruginibacter sp.]|nr:hypothetical protein [Ferruginibacter sp.]